MKKTIVVVAAAILILIASVGTTMAYIVASSKPVRNTFTVGHVQLSLTETTGDTYQLIPGTSPAKDPVLTVNAGSEACWLFFKIEKSAEFDNYVTFSVADGWQPLEGYADIYYRSAIKADTNMAFPLLKDNQIHIKPALTEQLLASLPESPKLTFTGYAVQRDGIATAQAAWKQILAEGGQTHE